MMCAGGCTWQWLQRTVQQPIGQSRAAAPSESPAQEPSQTHELHIQNQHIKHTRRLLRLFRRALSKQTLLAQEGSSAVHGSESQTQTPATAPRTCDPTCTESTLVSDTASSSVTASNCNPADCFQTVSATAPAPAPDSAVAQAPSALIGADSAADCAMSASTQPRDGMTAAGYDSSSVPDLASISKATLLSQARPSAERTILVEAIIPDHPLAANTCHAPCLLNLSVTPQALASYYPGSTLQLCASAAFSQGIDAQRALAESLMQQHMQRSESGWKGGTPIQLSSSVKVSHH